VKILVTLEVLRVDDAARTLPNVPRDVAFGFAERITVLYQGRVLIEGPKEVVSANRSVQESYLGLLVE